MKRNRMLAHTECTPLQMALKNLANAERALALATAPDAASYCPHPIVIVRAELANVARHLALIVE